MCEQKVAEDLTFWTVNGSTTFGVMPGGLLPGIDDPLPIKLQQGDGRWGAIHIQKRHSNWLLLNKHSAASMVHMKLQQHGTVYSAEEEDKSKILLTLTPSALLILKHIPAENFLGVTSVYFKDSEVDGLRLGRYKGTSRARAAGPTSQPVFALAGPLPSALAPVVGAPLEPQLTKAVTPLNIAPSNDPVIIYKKKKRKF